MFFVDGKKLHITDQQKFDVFLELSYTNGLIDSIERELHPLLHTELAMITDGNHYTCSSVGKGSVLGSQNHQVFWTRSPTISRGP